MRVGGGLKDRISMSDRHVVATNREGTSRISSEDSVEAGLVLTGSEIRVDLGIIM